MDMARFQRWLDDYVAAWRSYDADAIGALFAEDTVYRYHPWDDAVTGRDAIVANWLEEPDASGSWEAEYRPWSLDRDHGTAMGVSRYLGADGTVDREYHNVFLCIFDADGRCSSFTELYLQRKD